MPLFTNIHRSEAEYPLRQAGEAFSNALSRMYEIFAVIEREPNPNLSTIDSLKKDCVNDLARALDGFRNGLQALRSADAWQGRVPWSAVASRIEDEVDARPVRLWAAEVFGNLPEDSREVSVEAVIAASMRFVEEFQGALMNFSPEPQDRLLVRTNALVAQAFRLQQISIAATRIMLRVQEELRRSGRR